MNSSKMKPAYPSSTIGYKYSATGIFGYAFFHDKIRMCTVTSIVVPSPPVLIEGYGMRWRSDFDAEATIFPGLTRYVRDDSDGAQVARLVYRDRWEYEINGSVTARCGGGSYSFSRSGKIAAQISRYKEGNVWVPESVEHDYEPYFEVLFTDEIDDGMKLLVSSFPMLRFGF